MEEEILSSLIGHQGYTRVFDERPKLVFRAFLKIMKEDKLAIRKDQDYVGIFCILA